MSRKIVRKKIESEAKRYLVNQVNTILSHPEMQDRQLENVMMSVQCTDGHIHHMVPHDNQVVEDMIQDLLELEGYEIEEDQSIEETKEIIQEPIIFKNRQALGDILMFTAAIRDFHKEFPEWPMGVSSTAMHLWDNNPYIDRSLTEQNAKVIEVGPSWLTNASNRDDRHFANAFRISIEQKLNLSIPQGVIKPDIWMSRKEVEAPPLIKPPYWIIVAGEKGDWTAKTYPFNRWQEFVKTFPQVKFVQVGAREHVHPDLNLPNVVNYIGKTQSRDTGIRDLINLFYHAEGSMGLVSFQMHLAAAFDMPCIVLAGAREPARFTRYPRHQYLCTDGCLPCASRNACWACDLEKACKNVIEEDGRKYPKCVDIIKTEDLIRTFQQFYEGGRLSLTESRKPTLPNPIAKSINTPKIIKDLKEKIPIMITSEQEKWNEKTEKWGFEWGGGSITNRDWEFLLSIIKNYNISSVLEFGAGLSTLLFNEMDVSIITFETNVNWITKIQEINSKCDIREWDGKKVSLEEFNEFDLAFVDGPPGGKSRKFSTKIASENAKIVIIHDAGREYEKLWQDKYIKGNFNGPIKGGHRCHLWQKGNKEIEPVLRIKNRTNSKLLKMVFNGSGEGGAERSTNWIMSRFIDKGWNVQYISPNEIPSGTFRKEGSNKVNFTNDLNEIAKPCDILMLCSNDWVWEFDHIAKYWENLKAERKVMYVNFRIGKIGKIPWTQNWDEYIFLSGLLESQFFKNLFKNTSGFQVKTKILPPPTDLSQFYPMQIDYSGELRIIRHSSQGDTKYSNDFNEKTERILEEFPKATIRLMPGPSFLKDFGDRVISHKRNVPSVPEFLKLGNLFLYDLPKGYTEGGPRTILEAMGAGLPVIAGSESGGPKDRVTQETGILYNTFEKQLEAIEFFNSERKREYFGLNAKEHAKKEFNPENWISAIVG